MAENTKIEWADHTFNPWTGCTKVGPGCDKCYAESWAKRSGTVTWGVGEPRRRTTIANWRKPLAWNEKPWPMTADGDHRRPRVFCASLADVFDNEVDPEWRTDLFKLILATPKLDWLLLTKRIGNAHRFISDATAHVNLEAIGQWPIPNLWLGATIVNQEEADRDIPKLLATPARVRFLLMEPLLGPVDLSKWLQLGRCKSRGGGCGDRTFRCGLPAGHDGDHSALMETCAKWFGVPGELHWVIVGGESGHGARPMHPELARSLRDQCAAAGTPFLFKQWGEWAPYDGGVTNGAALATPNTLDTPMGRVGKKFSGRLLDGVTHDEFPKV